LFQETAAEMIEDHIIVRGLMPGEMYEFSVVAVDGEHMTESEVEEVEISNMGEFMLWVLPSYIRKVVLSFVVGTNLILSITFCKISYVV
jgi:hypothetical protein